MRWSRVPAPEHGDAGRAPGRHVHDPVVRLRHVRHARGGQHHRDLQPPPPQDAVACAERRLDPWTEAYRLMVYTEDVTAWPTMVKLAGCLCSTLAERGLPELCVCAPV